MQRTLFRFLLALAACFRAVAAAQTYDLLVYGGTPAGVMAAVAAKKEGLNVALVEPTRHIGGMMASGLGGTDKCIKEVIGGMSKDFFVRNGARYGKRVEWRVEPHIAEELFNQYLREAGVTAFLGVALNTVSKAGKRIAAVQLGQSTQLSAHYFIDASYEGDLMAKAGISYALGRESSSEYGETLAGVAPFAERDQFPPRMSGLGADGALLPYVNAGDPAALGSADYKLPSYNYRVCLSCEAGNFREIEPPASYQREDYLLLAQYLHTKHNLKLSELLRFLKIPSNKFDINNRGPFSTNMIGASWEYPEAAPAQREEIRRRHRDYTQGLLYFLAHDRAVPGHAREVLAKCGLCADEFKDNANWPYQLYVREARRLVGAFVLRQQDLSHTVIQPDPIGVGSCPIEAHHVQRLKLSDHSLRHEGWVWQRVTPYQIPYRAILPKADQAENLLVPVALSSSHIAFSSVRMEPTFMVLGQSAGVAVALAKKQNLSVQRVDASKLVSKLKNLTQIVAVPERALRRALDTISKAAPSRTAEKSAADLAASDNTR
ncbi:MAG: FAD-dependent oxidoreductase [Oligoflexia bacterium]|nr:FAD-dependent oxidoreductase [Oligoflexia bacterium]